MINTKFNIEKKEIEEFPPLPKNVYAVELLDVTPKEVATYDTRLMPTDQQVLETKLNFQFTILKGKDGETDLRGRNIWRGYVPTCLSISKKNGKNPLYRIIEAILGKELDLKDEAGMDSDFLLSLIGGQCRVSVEPVVKGDKTWDKIMDFLVKEDDLPELTNAEKEKSRVKKNDDLEVAEEIKFDEALKG